METKRVLAVDYGASSGRVMLGGFDGNRISMEEIHRFPNDPVILGDTMYWDVLRLFHEMKQGMVKAKKAGPVTSIGVDTWGVDFGLLDKDGRLLENPVHYRDNRTEGMVERVLKQVDAETLYNITGNQVLPINTLYQLMALKCKRPELLERAKDLLLMPDLFQYFLSGEKISECSIASTTQLLDVHTRKWSKTLLDQLGIPGEILRPVISGAVRTGSLLPSLQQELGYSGIDVTAVAGHDTQSAMVAVPAKEKSFLFISCGTWSLFGTELQQPVISQMSQACNLTNEAGLEGTTGFLKNIIGLWLIQESRRQWGREGLSYGFGELEQMAKNVKPLKNFVDPNAPEFVPAGDMPGRIRSYCERSGQLVPQTVGEVVCCIDQSLAMTYRKTLEEVERCTGKQYPVIYLVGGGAQSELLCQMTANACGVPVYAGPVEVTVYGNLAAQYMAQGEIGSLEEARDILRKVGEVKVYEPTDQEIWRDGYEHFIEAAL